MSLDLLFCQLCHIDSLFCQLLSLDSLFCRFMSLDSLFCHLCHMTHYFCRLCNYLSVLGHFCSSYVTLTSTFFVFTSHFFRIFSCFCIFGTLVYFLLISIFFSKCSILLLLLLFVRPLQPSEDCGSRK